MTIPAVAFKCRTANDNSGVERGPSKMKASQPFSAATLAARSVNSLEKNRVSCAITIFGWVSILFFAAESSNRFSATARPILLSISLCTGRSFPAQLRFASRSLFAGTRHRDHKLAVFFGNEHGTGAARTAVLVFLLDLNH